jgi:DNA-binding NtrC family response regulator
MEQSLFPVNPILFIDDDTEFLNTANLLLKINGINNSILCSDSDKVKEILKNNNCSMIILDLIMPKISGSELLKEIIADFPDIPVVILTGDMSVEKAVECIKIGAYDYIVKPLDKERFLTVIRNLIKLNEIKNENKLLKEELISENDKLDKYFSHIITKNKKMLSIFHYVKAIAKTDLPVFITGDTGTGKELLAHAIHEISGRKGEFVAINIAGLDDNMILDTLFGHKKGSFTSSIEDRKGLLDKARNGTLFLDEIGDLNVNSQIKLLRVLQDRKYFPIGSDKEEFTDARLVFATNQDINKLLQENKFRQDFYFRLQSHHIHLPQLRERPDDIPLLVDHFFNKASIKLKKKKPDYPKELINMLQNYHFPGNIRELEGIIFDIMSQYNGADELDILKIFEEKLNIKHQAIQNSITDSINALKSAGDKFYTLKEIEKIWIDEALKKANGNQTVAAKLLGMSRRALNNRLSRNKYPRHSL